MDATVLKKGPCQCIGGTKLMEVTTHWKIVTNASNGGRECENAEGPEISLQECLRSNRACSSSSEAALGFLLALALFTSLLCAACIHSNNKNLSNDVVGRAPQSLLGNHIVLEKDGELKINAGNLINRETQLEEEFHWLEAFDEEKISKMMLKTVAVQDVNRLHNRYIDIGKSFSCISQLDFHTQLPMTTTMCP